MSNIKYPFKTWWFNDEEWVSRHRAQEMANLLSSKDAEIQQQGNTIKQLRELLAHKTTVGEAMDLEIAQKGREIQQLKEEVGILNDSSNEMVKEGQRLITRNKELESKGATREQIEKAIAWFEENIPMYDLPLNMKLYYEKKSEYIESQFPQGDVNNDKK